MPLRVCVRSTRTKKESEREKRGKQKENTLQSTAGAAGSGAAGRAPSSEPACSFSDAHGSSTPLHPPGLGCEVSVPYKHKDFTGLSLASLLGAAV